MSSELKKQKLAVLNHGNNDELDNKRPISSISLPTLTGLIIVITIFFGLGIWAALAPIAEAVPASAVVSEREEKKQIQHLEGGIVAGLFVQEGQSVKKGDLLVSLNPLQASATLSRFHNRMDQALARKARLQAELSDQNYILYDGKLLDRLSSDVSVQVIVDAEEQQFLARRESFKGTISILRQRLKQLRNEIKGLEVQRKSRYDQLKIFAEELLDLRQLYEKGFYRRSQVLALERAVIELEGLAGGDSALIARAVSSMGETERQIINVKQRFHEDVVRQLSEIKSQIADLEENVVVAKDVLGRTDILAPISGVVQSLRVHTIGGVVNSGTVLMDIAPKNDDLVVKATVSPNDIDSIEKGQKAEVRLTSLNVRTSPTIYGVVAAVSGDAILDQASGGMFFLARVEIPKEERIKLNGINLTSGMPAEVLIQTGERTVLDYLLKPMTDALARGMNED